MKKRTPSPTIISILFSLLCFPILYLQLSQSHSYTTLAECYGVFHCSAVIDHLSEFYGYTPVLVKAPDGDLEYYAVPHDCKVAEAGMAHYGVHSVTAGQSFIIQSLKAFLKVDFTSCFSTSTIEN